MGKLIDLNGLGHFKDKENAMVASVYSATKTYAVGDYVYYNGTLYRCTTAITTAEAWTAGHWTAAKIGDDVTELKTAFTGITEPIDFLSVTDGLSYTGNGVTIENSDGKLKCYGTASASRYAVVWNGKSGAVTSSGTFAKVLEAGTYIFDSDVSGTQEVYSIRATYTTFSNQFTIVTNQNKKATVTFTAPVMIGYYFISGRNYGTNENPTYLTVKAQRITAVDDIARAEISSEANEIAKVSTLSNGNLSVIPTTGFSPFSKYETSGGSIVETDSGLLGTDYIKCPKYLCVCFDDDVASLYLYFFSYTDNKYTPKWDLLDITANDNVKNLLTRTNSENRVIEIPDNTYMKLTKVGGGNVSVYGWSGKHFGNDTASTTYTPTASEPFGEVPVTSNRVGMTIPGNAELIVLKSGAISAMWGVAEDGTKTLLFTGKYWQAYHLPSGYKYFRARMGVGYTAPYNAPHGEGLADCLGAFNFNDYCSILNSFEAVKPQGYSKIVSDNLKYLSEFEWTCRRGGKSTSDFHYEWQNGTTYKGIPYGSDWTRAYYFGWHITKHTFINAANDSRSILYTRTGRNGGLGYGQVCSITQGLAAGWAYPVSTNGYYLDPKCIVTKHNQPQIGEVMSNGGGHAVFVESLGNGSDYLEYSIIDGISPMVAKRTLFDAYTLGTDARNYKSLDAYVYEIHHKDETGNMNRHYDVINGTITNGSARPLKGDRCVYTSIETISIGIKNQDATKCYYQPATYDETTKEFTLTGSPQTVDVSGTVPYYFDMDKTTLTDNTFYALWTDADDVKEYFEYHVVPTVTYSISENNFVFNVPNYEFWYACWWEDDTAEGITETVPYIQSGDYSEYRKVYTPTGDGKMFFKGVLGAYVAPLTLAT